MKNFLCLGLFHLLYSTVYASPFIHFGRCVSSLSDKAHCLTIDKCDFYRNEVNITESSMCIHSDASLKLVCCPKIIPVTKLQQVKVEPTPTKATTETPKSTEAPVVGSRFTGISSLPQPPYCGLMLSDRIYGGKETQLDEFPWMVLIEYTTNKGREFLCGGSLINDRWVLTAAHCITGLSDATLRGVRLGEWNTETDFDCITNRFGVEECAPKAIDMAIDRNLPHPLYDRRKFINDIGLLRLARPITFTQFIKPICLPTKAELRTDTFLGAKADVSGWGRTEHNDTKSTIKLKAQLDILNLPYCQQKYNLITSTVRLNDNQLCAGGVLGVDSCGGDSGGPLILELPNGDTGNAFYQVGIVSFGMKRCGISDTPGVYARVGAYMDWIDTTIADNQN